MVPSILEGTWEEVSLHGHELAGRRVRVIVLDEPAGPSTLDVALAPLIAEAETLTSQLPADAGPHQEDAWSEGVAEKFRRQGFRP